MTAKINNLKYFLLLLSVTAIWGFGFIAVKFCTNHYVPVFLLMFIRFFIGAVMIFGIRFVLKRPKISKKELIYGIILGFIAFVAYGLQTYGQVFTTSGKSGMITGIYVIIIPIVYCVIKRSFRFKPIVDGLICLVGMVIFFGVFNESLEFNLGDGLTLLCSFMYAAQIILLDKYSKELDVYNFAFIQMLTVAVFSIIISLSTEIPSYVKMDSVNVIYALLYLGVLSTGFAFTGQTVAQAHLSANTAGVICCMESVFSIFFSLIFGYDKMQWYIIVGGIIMLVAMLSSVALPMDKPFLKSSKTESSNLKG